MCEECQELDKEIFFVPENTSELPVSPPSLIREETPQDNSKFEKINSGLDNLFREVRDIHKVCQNFLAGHLRELETELDKYHDIDRGRAFNDVLESIARIYLDYEHLPDEIDDTRIKQRTKYFLLDIIQVLESYGVHVQKSNLGEKRNLRFTQVEGYVETEDEALIDTVAESKRTGFYREKSAVIKEIVSLYIKKEIKNEQEANNENNEKEG